MNLTEPELERIVASAFWHFDEREKDLPTYHDLNRTAFERVAKAWHECVADELTALARCVCYAWLGHQYKVGEFDPVAELHFEHWRDSWLDKAKYIRKSLAGLI